jgi:formylmethanofuran dehydrogenase subunit A
MFASPRYVIKGGEIVVEDGELRGEARGRTLVVQPVYDEMVEDYLGQVFDRHYTVSFENYAIDLAFLGRTEVVRCT